MPGPEVVSTARKALADVEAGKLQVSPQQLQRLQSIAGQGGQGPAPGGPPPQQQAPSPAPQDPPPGPAPGPPQGAPQGPPPGPPQAGPPAPGMAAEVGPAEMRPQPGPVQYPAIEHGAPQMPPPDAPGMGPTPPRMPEPMNIGGAMWELDHSINGMDAVRIDANDLTSTARALERADQESAQRGELPDARSASRVAALYAPPVAGYRPVEDEESPRPLPGTEYVPGMGLGAQLPKGHDDFLFFEPTVDEPLAAYQGALAWADENGDRKMANRMAMAIEQLESKGRESEVYKRYADAKWQQAARAAEHVSEGQRAVRVAYAPEEETRDILRATGWPGAARGMFHGMLQSQTFEMGAPLLDLLTSQADTPIGRKMAELGWQPTGRMESIGDETPWYEEAAGWGLGLLSPMGLASTAAKGIGKAASALEGRAGRMAADAGLNFGVDASSSAVRQALEMASTGAHADVRDVAARALVEGALGGGAQLGGGAVADTASGMVSRAARFDPEIRALEASGVRGRRGSRTKGVLDRDVGKMVRGEPESATDEVFMAAEREVDRRRRPGSVEHVPTMGEAAAEYAAREIRPDVSRGFKRLTSALDEMDERYASQPGLGGIPQTMDNAYASVRKYFDSVRGSTDDVSQSAARILDRVSDVHIADEGGRRAALARGYIVVPKSDPLVSKLNQQKVRDAERRFEEPADSMFSQKQMSTIGAGGIPDELHRSSELSGPLTSADTGPGVPLQGDSTNAGKRGVRGQGAGDPFAAPGEPSLTPPQPSYGGEQYVVLAPKDMTAREYLSARRAAADAISYGAENETGKEAARVLDTALREEAAKFKGMKEHLEKQSSIMSRIRQMEGHLGGNRRELSGEGMPEADVGSTADRGLAKLENTLRTRQFQPGQRANSEAFAEALSDNPRALELMRAVRSVVALERMRGMVNDPTDSVRGVVSSSGPRAVISDVGQFVKDVMYGRGKSLERMRQDGRLNRNMRILLTPSAQRLLGETLTPDEINGLYEAYLVRDPGEEDTP